MTVPEITESRRFSWPAEYYSAPSGVPRTPRWITWGCGAASLAMLAGIFLLGVVLRGGGFTTFIDFAIGMSLGEMRGQFAPDVSDQQKSRLEAEIEAMRTALREEKISVAAIQPFLEERRTPGIHGRWWKIKDAIDAAVPAPVKRLLESLA